MKALYSYSPLEDSWTLIIQLGCERASCGIAACNNKLFITGGRDDKNEVISTVLCWNPETKKLTEECVLPRGVSHHGSVTLRKSYTHIRRIATGTVAWHIQQLQRLQFYFAKFFLIYDLFLAHIIKFKQYNSVLCYTLWYWECSPFTYNYAIGAQLYQSVTSVFWHSKDMLAL